MSTQQATAVDIGSLPPEEARLAQWIEAEAGGRLTAFERQPRWRPMYLADVETAGGTLKLIARHERHGRSPQAAYERSTGTDQLNADVVLATRDIADLIYDGG
jgi:hypothetical protein